MISGDYRTVAILEGIRFRLTMLVWLLALVGGFFITNHVVTRIQLGLPIIGWRSTKIVDDITIPLPNRNK